MYFTTYKGKPHKLVNRVVNLELGITVTLAFRQRNIAPYSRTQFQQCKASPLLHKQSLEISL